MTPWASDTAWVSWTEWRSLSLQRSALERFSRCSSCNKLGQLTVDSGLVAGGIFYETDSAQKLVWGLRKKALFRGWQGALNLKQISDEQENAYILLF